ncbi:MAG: hypothetical protein R3350_05800, partial [Saprospiraceae bacterium]|nr:hypothetical protein [Saprospiraceae bacterium]
MKPVIRILILLIAAALSTWMAAEMYMRYQRDLLWGYRPLLLFFALWALVVLLFPSRGQAGSRVRRRLGLVTLSGVLLSLGFPDLLPFPPVIFVGFVPLFILEKELSEERGGTARQSVFAYAFLAFLLWNILTTYWVANTALAAGIFAILANSLLMCIPFLLFHQTRAVMPRFAYVSLIAYWIVFEYAHMQWELTWPWLTLGNSFAEWPWLVQWYEYTGAFGGTLWILAINILIFRIWQRYGDGEISYPAIAKISAWMLIPAAISLWMYFDYEESGETIEVVAVQPNYEPHYEKFAVSEYQQLDRMLSLADAALINTTDYVVYPETSFGYVIYDRIEEYPAVRRIRRFLQDHPQLTFVIGISALDVLGPEEERGPATRVQVRGGDTTYFESLNAAVQIRAGERGIPLYRKSKLVPGAEIFPYRDLFWFFGPLIDKLQGTWEGTGTQRERSVLS